jgi:glycerol-3-phosphate dehydrogenase
LALRQLFWHSHLPPFDVAVVGGGVQGAAIFHSLARTGHRTLLIDRGDFAAATSQASAMLVWGGLLYLRNAEFAEVFRLCSARDRMLRDRPGWVEPHTLRYVFGHRPHRPQWLVHSGLWLYWVLGRCRRRPPRRESRFPEQAFLARGSDSLRFEEARLLSSDAGFVANWIFSAEFGGPATGSRAVNYCELLGGHFEAGLWHLHLADALFNESREVCARWVVNAAGVWADAVNACFSIETPFKHVFSKGVSFTFPRHPLHRDTLAFDSTRQNEGMCLVPWGPVSLWGSTETPLEHPKDGFHAEPSDVSSLLDQLNRQLAQPLDPAEIISLRCGARPLAVLRSHRPGDPLGLSRRHYVWRDPYLPWITTYGGKITGCQTLAGRVASLLPHPGSPPSHRAASQMPSPSLQNFPGLEQPVPSPRWSLEHTQCHTLADYLRRRTNIAQWVPRGGLGRSDEHRQHVLAIARTFSPDEPTAQLTVDQYAASIDRQSMIPKNGHHFSEEIVRHQET